jgi:hypothetical protein
MVRYAAVVAVVLVSGASAQVPVEDRQTPNTLRAAAGGTPPPATLADVRWLTGAWRGTGMGGLADEMFSEPAAGAMIGTFRLLIGGKVVFYQFLTMVEEDGSLALKLKHFNADLTGWEEKDRFVTFRLVRITPTEAFFGGLTFRRVGDDRLQVFLAQRMGDGAIREQAFDLARALSGGRDGGVGQR